MGMYEAHQELKRIVDHSAVYYEKEQPINLRYIACIGKGDNAFVIRACCWLKVIELVKEKLNHTDASSYSGPERRKRADFVGFDGKGAYYRCDSEGRRIDPPYYELRKGDDQYSRPDDRRKHEGIYADRETAAYEPVIKLRAGEAKQGPQHKMKLCVDCEHYNRESWECVGRGVISIVTGEEKALDCNCERADRISTSWPMTDYESCGPGAKHWKAKEE